MPILPDEMYCSEQICIPPSFPYLLRQYAKAAIRTQPSDLLRWSTAYFRCLSLNIQPPVKPRLEYPIPRDFNGITPGWLKALLYQLQNNLTIPFKILWDRWIGACLQHTTLIQLLCLGGFEDPQAIPWLRFIAICASTLTDNLTHTMIMICEILTEEPEGGSAMITLETFVDLYTFLAKIDASKAQNLRNYFFRDSLLSLWREKVEKEELKEVEQEIIILESEESVASKISTESGVEKTKSDDVDKVVSCPSLPEDDHYSIGYLLKDVEEAGEEFEQEMPGEGEEVMTEVKEEVVGERASKDESEEDHDEGNQKSEEAEKDDEKDNDEEEIGEPKEEIEGNEFNVEQDEKEEGEIKAEEPVEGAAEIKGDIKEEEQAKDETQEGVKEYESVETITDQPVRDLEHIFEDDQTLKEDLERLRALQQELAGETDEELEKFKCRLIEEMPLTQSQEEGVKHFKIEKLDHQSSEEKLKVISGEILKSGDFSSDSQELEEEKRQFDDIFVEAIPGIGGTVPEDLIKAVVEYMKKCAKIQHGMVMPRNIRHYSCPPLEVLQY